MCQLCGFLMSKVRPNPPRILKVFRGHVVASFADLQSGRFDISPAESPRNEPTCDRHTGEKMRFYCKTCQEAICPNCTVLDHPKPEHAIRDIHSVALEQREIMSALQVTAETKLTELEKTSTSLDSELKHLEKRRDMRRQELKKKVSGLTSAIEKLGKQCEETIQKEFVLNEKTSVARRQDVDMVKCRLESTREFVANILSHGSDAEIAATFKQVEDSIVELTSTTRSCRMEEDQDMAAKSVDFGASPTFQLFKKMKEIITDEQRSIQTQAWGETSKELRALGVESCGAHAQPVTSPQGVPNRPWDPSRIVLKGVPKHVTEDELCLNLTTLGITDVKPRSIVYGSRQGTVMVECSDVISDLDGKLRAIHRTKSFGSKVTAEKVLICDCVEVNNLPPHANNQSLFTYFNKQRRSGGGGVIEVKVDEDKRTALVSFQNYKVVERVLDRRHVMGKVELVVKPFYTCLGQTASNA
ncbi:TRIM2 [Branchiostoma lanceolatum]|uniref:TRIM2 protein n=1 Tax=Branchiostoma lanceolatum TaxID=7740 RepID=A0A8K0ECJ2_BRALA|nr:TRIM2 [Branchiostoma lanceolatum]